MSGSLIRDTPPWARMSAGTRSRAITATAPASSAIFACSAVTTSMMTPPLSISAMPRLTRLVPCSMGVCRGCAQPCLDRSAASSRRMHRDGRGRALDQACEAARASAWRRTTQMRWATVTVAATARAQRATSSRIQAGRGRRRRRPGTSMPDETVGALGDADLGVVAEVVGLGPGVRRHRAHHQDDEAQHEVEAALRDARRSRAPAPPKSAPSATRSSVESRKAPKSSLRPTLRAIAPSIRSLKTKAVMNRTPCQTIPCGKKTSAPEADAEGADQRHHVGADAEADEEVDEGREHDALPELLEPVEHGRRLPVEQRRPDVRHRGGRPGRPSSPRPQRVRRPTRRPRRG